MEELMDLKTRLPYDPWWGGLKDVVYVVSDPMYEKELEDLPMLANSEDGAAE